MNLHIDELLQGFIDEQQFINKYGSAVFDQTHNGAMFPTADKQSLWQFSKGDKHLRLSNGTNVFHFNVDHHNPDNEEMDLSRGPDVPLPDMFTNSSSKGKAQVHRSDPSSIYFTLQEGTKNPTYTIRHIGGDKWKALPKRKTVKQQMANPAPIPNINVESLKEAMHEEAGSVAKDFFPKQPVSTKP